MYMRVTCLMPSLKFLTKQTYSRIFVYSFLYLHSFLLFPSSILHERLFLSVQSVNCSFSFPHFFLFVSLFLQLEFIPFLSLSRSLLSVVLPFPFFLVTFSFSCPLVFSSSCFRFVWFPAFTVPFLFLLLNSRSIKKLPPCPRPASAYPSLEAFTIISTFLLSAQR